MKKGMDLLSIHDLSADDVEEMSLTERYAAHIAKGLDKKEAMRRTAQELGISRRDVYQALLAGDV